MTLEELIKSLGLDAEDMKDKAQILKKEFNSKTKEVTELTKKLTQVEEDLEAGKGIKEKLDIVSKALSLDLEAEDLDAMLDEVKDGFVKQAGGGSTPEEVKALKRDLTKVLREREKLDSQLKEVTEQLNTEKTQRINQTKTTAIRKALDSNNILKPDQMVDLFINKVNVDEDGSTMTIKSADGTELTIGDYVADFAKENPEFVLQDVKGGAGSGSNLKGSKVDSTSDFMKTVLANRTQSPNGAKETLESTFG